MKRLLIFCLVLIVSCVVLSAEAQTVIDYISSKGFAAEKTVNTNSVHSCNCSVISSHKYIFTWSDASYIYSVEGIPNDILPCIKRPLAWGKWQSCVLTIGNRARVTYNSGIPSRHECESLDEFVSYVNLYMRNTYRPIKQINRKDVFETREKIIDQGYKPCGHCNP